MPSPNQYYNFGVYILIVNAEENVHAYSQKFKYLSLHCVLYFCFSTASGEEMKNSAQQCGLISKSSVYHTW
jgi:hypothetical protein